MSYFSKVYGYYSLLFSFMVWVAWLMLNFVLVGAGVVVELDVLASTGLSLNVPFVLDLYSVVFSFVVLIISSSVVLYNGFYMDGENYYNRFCKLVLLFVLSMLFLVFIPNLLGLMIGWDGLGLTSYLLVIYYQDKRSLGSGTLTVLSNRIGDVLFFMGISLASGVSSWGHFDLGNWGIVSLLSGVLVVGCMTKSAQIPFSAWLPAAMAAPTPVSALVHSSTLVTAGVYVLVRFSSCISAGWYVALGLISTLTMFMAAFSAVFEPDVKKVVALSTLSQLGVMMLAISVGSISVCFFHLVSHALFKALMFLCVGGIIHFTGIQDLRYLGGFIYKSPVISGWLCVACLSLMGFPFLSGFYSKDLVLEAFLHGGSNFVLLVLVSISTCLTVFYSVLVLVSVFGSSVSQGFTGEMHGVFYIVFPCCVLGLGALFGGVVMQSIVLEFNVSFILQGIVKVMPISCVMVGGIFLVWFLMSGSLGLYNNHVAEVDNVSSNSYMHMVSKMWFLPFLSSDLFSSNVLGLSGDVKQDGEDGYMEFSLGSEGAWCEVSGLSSKYISGQMEMVGVCLLKGLVLVVLTLMVVGVGMFYNW